MKKPSPSLIISLIALFVALTSSAIATTVVITSSAQVKDGVLRLKDFKKSDRAKLVGPAGPAGAPGATGPQGSPGTVNIGPWHYVGAAGEPPFGETFSNNSSESLVRFRLEGDVVRLQGIAKTSQSCLWNGCPKRVVFTLPEGFRPSDPDMFIPIQGAQSTEPGSIHIGSDGQIVIGGSTSGFLTLSGVTFAIS